MTRYFRPIHGDLALVLLAFLSLSTAAIAQDRAKIEIVPNVSHSLSITASAVSPDGTRLVSGGGDKLLKLWDTATGRLLRTMEGHSESISSVAFSPDGARLLSASQSATIVLWDAATGGRIRSWAGHRISVTSVAFSPDGKYILSAGSDSGLTDHTLTLWDAESGQRVRTFEGHAKGVTSAAFSPDGMRVLSGSEDNTVKLWDVESGRAIHTLTGHSDRVNAVAFSRDGSRLLSGGYEETLRLWDAVSGQLIRTFERSNWVASVAFSPDGTRLLSAGTRGFKLWDAASGQLIHNFTGHELPVESVHFMPDGRHIVSAADNIKLWDATSGQLIRTFGGYSSSVQSVAGSPDGAQLLSGGADKTIKLWDAASGQLVRTFVGHSNWLESVAFSPDGKRMLSGSHDKTLRLWDVASGQVIRAFEGHSRIVNSVAFSPDGMRLLSGSSDQTIKLWDGVSGQLIRTFEGHLNWVNSVTFSPSGEFLLSGSSDGTFRLWDVAKGQDVGVVQDHKGGVWSVAFSTDGRRFISGGGDNTIKLWDVATGQMIRSFHGHSSRVDSVAFSADGTRLLSSSWDKTVRLWDVESGRSLRTLEGHAGWVRSAVFLADGALIASASSDGTVRIWNVATGEHLASLFSSPQGEWLVITPDGFFDASAKGAEMLSIVRSLDVFSIDQFYQTLYRPDLVREKLAGDPNGKVKDATAKLDLAKLLGSGRPPRVTITSHGAEETSSVDLVTVEAELTDQGGGIGRAEWRINGVTIGVVDQPAAAAADQPVAMKQVVALDPGENTIELTAYNGADLVAAVPARSKIVWTGSEPTAQPRLYVLVVGINNYLDAALKLTYAVPDAKALAAALKQAGQGYYEDVIITHVLDRDATASGLDRVFADLAAKVRPRDVFMFFAAGHGKTLDGRYYFVPYDLRYQTDQSLERDAIGQDKLQAWFSRVRAKKAILMFDTCEAGTLTERAQTRGGLEQKAAVGRLIRATGRATLTASTATQAAYEGYGGHGVFSFSLLDALGRADTNNNGLVELAELIQHVDGLVPAITERQWGAKQFPQMDAYGANFPLTRQVATLAPDPGDAIIIPIKPTHVNTEMLQIFKEASGAGGFAEQLPPFTTVTLVKSNGGWALVARDGKALGYVADGKLHKLN